MKSERDLSEINAEIETLGRENRYSRTKTLVELFISSAIMLGTFAFLFPWFDGPQFPFPFRLAISAVATFNILAWLFWILDSMLLFYRSIFFGGFRAEVEVETDLRFRYESNLYTLMRQKRVERVVDMLVGLQFVTMGFLVASLYAI